MNYFEFLKHVVEDGITAAREDYTHPDQQSHLNGSISGFEACEHRTPDELMPLLERAKDATIKAFRNPMTKSETYWYLRCREAEIEWVCNVVSAMLVNEGKPPIVPVTARGALKAAEVLKCTS